MKKSTIYILAIIALALTNLLQLGWSVLKDRLPWDAVPTEESALRVGTALMVSVYGESVLNSTPFRLNYDEKRRAWVISEAISEDINYVGGIPGIVFRKRDGKILSINNSM